VRELALDVLEHAGEATVEAKEVRQEEDEIACGAAHVVLMITGGLQFFVIGVGEHMLVAVQRTYAFSRDVSKALTMVTK
jgi:hypothetical protein